MDSSDPKEIQKYIQQIERKREYNRRYYHNRVKPKREQEKKELVQLRERCNQLENYIIQLQKQLQIQPDSNQSNSQVDVLSEKIKHLSNSLNKLQQENKEYKQLVDKLQQENKVLADCLEVARKRNYELMLNKADQLLPKLEGVTLNS